MVSDLKMDDKPAKLVRSSSIEKIRRFNSYICSQNYFFLPALLSLVKTSQSGVNTQKERTIFFFHLLRSLIFNTYIYKFFMKQQLKNVREFNKEDLKSKCDLGKTVLQSIISNFYAKFTQCFESTFVQTSLVFAAAFFIVSQLLICIYLLALVHVPVGLYFLIACLGYVNYLHFKINKSLKNDLKRISKNRKKDD